MRLTDVVDAIDGGALDEHLEAVSAALRDRRRALARRRSADLQRGDTVEFLDGVSPNYLAGLSAQVVRTNRETVTVNCPDLPEYHRYRNYKGLRVPSILVRRA